MVELNDFRAGLHRKKGKMVISRRRYFIQELKQKRRIIYTCLKKEIQDI